MIFRTSDRTSQRQSSAGKLAKTSQMLTRGWKPADRVLSTSGGTAGATAGSQVTGRALRSRRQVEGFILGLFLGGVALPVVASAQEFELIGQGAPIGTMTVENDGSQETIHYGYSNNGRGANWDSQLSLGPDGLPTKVVTKGTNLLRLPFEDTLSTDGSSLTWVSSVDRGQSKAHAFYVPLDVSPEHVAMLARALLKTKGNTVDLAPTGRGTLVRTKDLAVTVGGQTRTVTLFLVNGLDLGSTPVWLNSDGSLFAQVAQSSGAINAVEKGWSTVVPELIEAQSQSLDERDRKLAATLGHRLERPLAFRHVRVFDAPGKRILEDMMVVVACDRIVSVVPDKGGPPPVGADTIEAKGKFLMPGLWDMHVHIQSNLDGQLDIATGITSARDMGNTLEPAVNWRKAFGNGELIGPRLSLAGLVDGRAAESNNASVKVTNEEELEAAVDLFARNGYIELKMYSSFPPALVPRAVELAHSHGMRAGGHVPAGLRMDEFVAAGVNDVAHLNFALLNFLGDDIQKNTNSLQRMLAPARLGSTIDVDSPAVSRSFAEMRRREVALDDTAIVLELLFTAQAGQTPNYLLPYAGALPAQVLRKSKSGGLARTPEELKAYTASFHTALSLLKRAYDDGVEIVPGTDGMAGLMLPHELELYVAAGLTPLEALSRATYGPAKVLKLDRDLGSVEPGKLADLVLVDGDPSKNIGAIRNLELVLKGGISYDPAAVRSAIGFR